MTDREYTDKQAEGMKYIGYKMNSTEPIEFEDCNEAWNFRHENYMSAVYRVYPDNLKVRWL